MNAPVSTSRNFRLFVGNMGSRMTEDELRELFKPYGTLENIHMVRDDLTGFFSGYAFVDMIDELSANRATTGLNGKANGTHSLVVRPLF